MTYKALYRTYRPKSFDDVAGQKHIVKTLKNAIVQNKIAHAYLFCGPRGTGKTSIAKYLLKQLTVEAIISHVIFVRIAKQCLMAIIRILLKLMLPAIMVSMKFEN